MKERSAARALHSVTTVVLHVENAGTTVFLHVKAVVNVAMTVAVHARIAAMTALLHAIHAMSVVMVPNPQAKAIWVMESFWVSKRRAP